MVVREVHIPDNRRRTLVRRCVVCNDPTPNGNRWCSAACFGEDDGFPDEEEDDG